MTASGSQNGPIHPRNVLPSSWLSTTEELLKHFVETAGLEFDHLAARRAIMDSRCHFEISFPELASGQSPEAPSAGNGSASNGDAHGQSPLDLMGPGSSPASDASQDKDSAQGNGSPQGNASPQEGAPLQGSGSASEEGQGQFTVEPQQDHIDRLIEAGKRLGLRIKAFEGTVAEAAELLHGQLPLATCIDDGSGEPQWLILKQARKKRVQLVTADHSDEQPWMPASELATVLSALGISSSKPSGQNPPGVGGHQGGEPEGDVLVSELAGLLGAGSPNMTVTWVLAQPALPCALAAAGEGSQKSPTPLSRLIALLRPEAKDLWIIVLFAVFVGLISLAVPIAVEALVNTVAFGKMLQPVVILALMLFTFLAFAATLKAFQTYLAELVQRRLFVRLVADLAHRLPHVRMHVFDKTHVPELVNRFFEIVTLQKVTALLMLDGVALVMQTIIGMMVLAFYHPVLLGFDVLLLGAIALMIFVLGRGAVGTSIKESKCKYQVEAWLEEIARYPLTFRSQGGGEHAVERANALATQYVYARKKHFRILMRQIIFALGVYVVASTVLLGLGGWLVIAGQLTLGQLVAAELIVAVILSSFANSGKYLESYYKLMASVDKLGNLFDLPVEHHDGEPVKYQVRGAQIRIRQLSFGYSRREDLYGGMDLQFDPGDRVALFGPLGSGKSTLLDLLFRLREPATGYVELDGTDLRCLEPAAVREQVALVRSIEVFSGTLAENVHLNRLGIGTREVTEALRQVGLLDEVLRLPKALNTELQSGGMPLSKSQLRRLMFARAIVGAPRLLMVDGLLDALPDECLSPIADALFDPNRTWTLVLVSGRQDLISKCNRRFLLTGQTDTARDLSLTGQT